MNPQELKNFKQIEEMQSAYYNKRIGQVFGVWRVTEVQYDWEHHRQIWTLRCDVCGKTKVIKDSKNLKKGRGLSCSHSYLTKTTIKREPINHDKSWLGCIFGTEKVVAFHKTGNKNLWVCECQLCHSTHIRVPSAVKRGVAPRCICQHQKYDASWVGKKYGNLEIIEYKKSRFVCRCNCGKEITVVPSNLIRGKIVSCGCVNAMKTSDRMTVHGDCKNGNRARLYRIYRGMIDRCTNPKSDNYANYGGRGIDICADWTNNYIAFREWALNNGYSDELSIDRIDNDKGYSPDNCRWTTLGVQRANQRPHKEHSKKIVWEINGEIKSAIEWCKQYDISVPTVMYRINKKGLSPFEALTMNKITSGRPKKAR
jgi:hypothetical protein